MPLAFFRAARCCLRHAAMPALFIYHRVFQWRIMTNIRQMLFRALEIRHARLPLAATPGCYAIRAAPACFMICFRRDRTHTTLNIRKRCCDYAAPCRAAASSIFFVPVYFCRAAMPFRRFHYFVAIASLILMIFLFHCLLMLSSLFIFAFTLSSPLMLQAMSLAFISLRLSLFS